MRGNPPGLRVTEFESDADTDVGWGRDGRKTSDLLAVDGTLYMFVRNARLGDDHRNARLAWSTDHGRTFEWTDWNFSETLGTPTFVQFGPDYANARDEYVYVVSQTNDDAYGFSPDVVLARVPKDDVPNRDAYEFYAGESGDEPTWSASIDDREAIFSDPKGTQRVAMTYNPGIDRYVLTASHEVDGQSGPHGPGLGLFAAPEPWGPWRTLYNDDDFVGGKGDGEGAYHYRFPPKWIGDNGRRMTMGVLAPRRRTLCLPDARRRSLAGGVSGGAGERRPSRTGGRTGEWRPVHPCRSRNPLGYLVTKIR